MDGHMMDGSIMDGHIMDSCIGYLVCTVNLHIIYL